MDNYGIDGGMLGRYHEVTAGMLVPVRCSYCPGIYDLAHVEVTGRYADCSIWKAPCCGVTVDDRGETGWKSTQDYRKLPRP